MTEFIENDYFTDVSPIVPTGKKMNGFIKELKDIGSKYQEVIELRDYDYNDLTDMLYETERMSLILRKSLNEKQRGDVIYYSKNNEGKVEKVEQFLKENAKKDDLISAKICMENYPVKFDFDGKIIKIFTPLTFKRGYRKENFLGNYFLSTYLENAIYQWQNDKKLSLYKTIQAPYIIVMKRTDLEFSIEKICDADNAENQRLINSITRAFGLPDNRQFMSLYSMFDEVDNEKDVGTWLYIFSEKDIEQYLYLFKKKDKGHVKDTFYRDISCVIRTKTSL
jgi:hypothetical protein